MAEVGEGNPWDNSWYNCHLAEGNPVEFAATSKCRFLDILQYPSLAGYYQSEGNLDDSSIEEWFSKVLNLSSPSEGISLQPSGGLRLLVGACDLNVQTGCAALSFSKESFEIVKTHFGLPNNFLDLLTSSYTRTVNFSSPLPGNKRLRRLTFKVPFYRFDFNHVTITHNPLTNLTTCLLLFKAKQYISSPLLSLFNAPNSIQHSPTQPLLLPVLALQFEVQKYKNRLITSDRRINDLQDSMGQHEYGDRPLGNPLEADFVAVTRALNHVRKRISLSAQHFGNVLLAVESLEGFQKHVKKQIGEQEEEEESEGSYMIEEKIEELKSECRSLLLMAEYEEKRTGTLIQVVYQFMAQKDAIVNINLAESSAAIAKASKEDSAVMRTIAIESKRDSSAMKTIAILGMFFLPGTFIAAIFAMPVYDWDGNGVPIVKSGFKYYWAVTIPLTAVVLLSWGLAMLLPWRAWVARISKSEKREESEGYEMRRR